MKHKYLSLTFAGLFSIFASPFSFSGDVAAGKSKAVSCAACHGQDGISSNPEWPNIAGQKEKYLINQLKAFKSGERKSAIMGSQVVNLSDDDIENISAYFSSLK